MDSIGNFRERFEALEQQMEQLMHQRRMLWGLPKVSAFAGAVLASYLALATLPSLSPAQGVALPHSYDIQPLGVSLRYPDGWSVNPYGDAYQVLNVPVDQQAALDVDTLDKTARIIVTFEHGKDHAEVVRRLAEIATEGNWPVNFLNIGGWPALQRVHLAPKPQPGQNTPLEESADETVDERVLVITTAVAAGDLLVRLEGRLLPDAPPAVTDQMEAIGASLVFPTTGDPGQVDQEITNLRSGQSRGSSLSTPLLQQGGSSVALASGDAPSADAQTSSVEAPGLTQRVITRNPVASEGEVAVSTNGQNIVVTAQNNYRTSNDGGQTFPFSGSLSFANRGDSSVAFGASGAFYLAGINNTAGCGGNPIRGCATGIDVSTPPNNGRTFAFRNNAVVCPNSGAGACFPDQEHIAADRFNAANRFNATAGNGDLLYSVWRNFPGPTPMLVCSSDGGQTWPTTRTLSGDFPRVTVGQDGFVYVVYVNGGNISLNKYSPCSAGLVQQGMAATVAAFTNVTCPVPGLDRCNNGNVLSSPTVAVDDTNPSHIYVAYASNTAAGNEDVFMNDSLDGGVTWPAARVVRVNNAVPGRRFMPWVCSTGGEAFVSWYDRRAATPCATPPCPGMNNDLTDYFAGSASLDTAGNLVAGTEFKINPAGSTDPQCAAGGTPVASPGWPCQVRNQNDSQSCSIQPQLGGRCCTATPCAMGDSRQACDFDMGPACPNAGETCRADPQAGCPKYGDYNGNACAVGRLFTIWASATPPPGIAVTGTIDTFFSVNLVTGPQLQVPDVVSFAGTCAGSTSFATLHVCNTGNTKLDVNTITSSNGQFAVTRPSAGYPVVISPDFCFPFQVSFTPTSTGTQTTTLTIASNDPANPSVTVQATATGMQQRLATVIANSGNFGNICLGLFADLNLTISNSGGCDLSVTGIASSSSPEFQTAQVMSFPLVIHAGDALSVPIRFQPTTQFALGVRTANITVSSNDPTTPTQVVAVSGTALAFSAACGVRGSSGLVEGAQRD
jgi:hypothetical protein